MFIGKAIVFVDIRDQRFRSISDNCTDCRGMFREQYVDCIRIYSVPLFRQPNSVGIKTILMRLEICHTEPIMKIANMT